MRGHSSTGFRDATTNLDSVLVLAFDTATPAVTVALRDDSAVLAERTVVDARRHGELLAPCIAAVLSAADRETAELTAIAVGVGPGPFTGLRVGLVTALALGDALRIRVYGVCSLDILAYASKLDGLYAVATDARRREVYWARYSGLARTEGPHVDRPGAAATQTVGLPVVGAGALLYPDDFPNAREPRFPTASALADWVALGRPTLPPQPLYLRRPDAVEPAARKLVTAASRGDRPPTRPEGLAGPTG
jgi:tRNA threonylcarbamoyl adenosine modification protein YeaZ